MTEGAQVAAVDVGTNSVLLLIAEQVGEARLARRHETCAITRLGQGIGGPDGALADEAVARTLAALEQVAAEISARGVTRVAAIGTAVLRRVRDAARFVAPAEALLGCQLEIVSGAREAELVQRGVSGAFGEQPQGTLIFDVGGGSTELVLLAAGGGRRLASLELGAVGLSEGPLAGRDPPGEQRIAAARREVATQLGRLTGAFAERVAAAPLIGVAGTVTTLATIELGLADYDSERVNGLCLAKQTVAGQVARLASLDLVDRQAIVGLEPARADVILGGALIVEGILARFGAEELRVCDRGVRWGLAWELARAGAV